MSKQLTIQQSAIENWDYDQSVKTFSEKIQQHQRLSLEIVREIFIAQQYFAKMGIESRKKHLKEGDSPKVSNETFGKTVSEKGEISFFSYLDAIGIRKPTAYRWLKRYIPGEDKLLELEEFKAIERKKREEHYQNIMNLVSDYEKTAIFPDGWNEECQEMYDKLHQGKIMFDPIEEIERQQKDFSHVFASKIKRASLFWDNREINAWSTMEAEPVRSLAQQVQFNHEKRSRVAHKLAEIEKVVASYPDETLAEIRIQIQNLQLALMEEDEKLRASGGNAK